MATERVTISVESNIGEDGPLTVDDAFDQFRDGLGLISAAIERDNDGPVIRWRLEALSKNSPAQMTAMAYCDDPDVMVGPVVHQAKARVSSDIHDLREGIVSDLLFENANLVKAILKRNLNGIGRTVLTFDDDVPMAVIAERSARVGIRAIEARELESRPDDQSREEIGSVDAHVTRADTYHGQPAIYIRDRLSGRVVPCVLSGEIAEVEGQSHSWHDTWTGKRVRVRGKIYYDKNGDISRVSAVGLEDVTPQPVDLAEIRSLNILDGKSPPQFLNELWGVDDDGS